MIMFVMFFAKCTNLNWVSFLEKVLNILLWRNNIWRGKKINVKLKRNYAKYKQEQWSDHVKLQHQLFHAFKIPSNKLISNIVL